MTPRPDSTFDASRDQAVDMATGMDYLDFGYVSGSCPINKTGQNKAASRLKCGVDKFGNSQYLCVPNFKKTAIVEYCYKGTVGLQNPGTCLVVNDEGIVDDVSCRSFTEGCTTTHFKSSDLYKYPACHQINRRDRCFYADPKCPKIDSEMTTRNRKFMVTNATMNNSATTLDFSNSYVITETGQIPAGAIAAITIALFSTLTILFFIYMIYLYKKRKGQSSISTTDKESVPLVNLREDNSKDEEREMIPLVNERKDISKDSAAENELVKLSLEGDKLFAGQVQEIPHKASEMMRDVRETSQAYGIQNNEFFTLTDDEVFVLFCFLCSDSGPPDFTDTEWLGMLNQIRHEMYLNYNKVTREEAQQTLDRLKSRDYLWEDQDKIPEDIKYKTMCWIASMDSLNILFNYSSYDTGSVYLRSWRYNKKPEEKCFCGPGYLLIRRVQMNILTHDTMNDMDIYDDIYKIYEFFTLTDDEVFVLFCFLCSDSGPPDFTDTEWLGMLNQIRHEMYLNYNKVTREEAQQTLDRLKSRDYLWEDQDKIPEDIKYKTMCWIASMDSLNILFNYSSYDTASVYLRSWRYNKKPEEKCFCGPGYLLIRRVQMNILTHDTMNDMDIYDDIYKILNVSNQILKEGEDKRKDFLSELSKGDDVHYRGRSHDSVDHVTWLWRYRRPDIVRSCIGLHQHNDIYLIDNKAYRKPSKYHKYIPEVRSLLYCLLLVDEYTLNTREDSYKNMLNKLRDKYFKEEEMSNEISTADLPEVIMQIKDNTITFKSDDIRHDVMYAFVTECLITDSDLEFFLNTASGHVITEYCRYWLYERSEGERCLYIPDKPNMLDPVIERLQLDIIKYCSISDRTIRDNIINRLGVPVEILQWDQEARERYVEYAKRGTQTVHHARGMIVGCAGAGKTTMLKRLLGCSEEEIKKIKSTEGLEVHEEIFKICDKTNTLEAIKLNVNEKVGKGSFSWSENTKTLTIFDFGGQCAYYACHQIYLTRRAFYVVVVDASKRLDQKVDDEVCDQDGSVFSGWTYGDYFVFWLKSIHTYCCAEDENQNPIVLTVATHWENRIDEYKDVNAFMDHLLNQLPKNCPYLPQYITEKNFFAIQFHVPIDDLAKRIASIAAFTKWEEKISKEWAIFGIHLRQKKEKKIIVTNKINVYDKENNKTIRIEDMLRFYHDSGKVLYFNEPELNDFVIIDVQWFVDAFKNIITDKLHLQGITTPVHDWEEYYNTGNLKDTLLTDIWKVYERFEAVRHKYIVLHFMKRLGLVALGEGSHYVPCMNRKEMNRDTKDIILQSGSRSSVVLYRFEILPFFFFFRLVVACMQEKG
ncbi:uncharacterized protein LOC134275821 [Saccostrea cucullata]|uniref:uncharacterized protein LOC134275821 n=1 Tax=Saccostrea cuccullata TaxID=36930 RepID=UPI002ED66198